MNTPETASPVLKVVAHETTLYKAWFWEPADGGVTLVLPPVDLFHGPDELRLFISDGRLRETARRMEVDEAIYASWRRGER